MATVSLFDTEESRQAPSKTFPIFGMARGGTTAVAGTVRELGVFLGEALPNNLEDRDFSRPRAPETEVIASRNDTYPVWGWKFPNAGGYIDAIFPALRNPRLIWVTRDLAANAIGVTARHRAFDVHRALEQSMLQQQRNFALVSRLRVPTLVVSYEKLTLKPELVVGDIADFLAVGSTEEMIQAAVDFVQPGGYQRQAGRKAADPALGG